jgi:hypothetical protein
MLEAILLKRVTLSISDFISLEKTQRTDAWSDGKEYADRFDADDGYPEGYTLILLLAGVALKYYPFENISLFAKADYGLGCGL